MKGWKSHDRIKDQDFDSIMEHMITFSLMLKIIDLTRITN